jgi:hypothetical protein
MKFIVIALIFVAIIYQTYSEFKSVSMKDKLVSKFTLEEKLMVPYGMEKEYNALFEKRRLKEYGTKPKYNSSIKKTINREKNLTPVKVKDFLLDNDNNLIATIIIGNRTTSMIEGNKKLSCNVLYKGEIVDFFNIKVSLNLKVNKAVMLRNVKLGYLTSSVIDDVNCKLIK